MPNIKFHEKTQDVVTICADRHVLSCPESFCMCSFFCLFAVLVRPLVRLALLGSVRKASESFKLPGALNFNQRSDVAGK